MLLMRTQDSTALHGFWGAKLFQNPKFCHHPCRLFWAKMLKNRSWCGLWKMEKFSESQHSSSKPRVSTAHINYISFQTRMPRILVSQNQNENINLSDLDIQRIVNFLYYQLNKTGKNIHKFNVVLKKMNNLVSMCYAFWTPLSFSQQNAFK